MDDKETRDTRGKLDADAPDKDVLDTWTDRVATNIDEIILDRIEPQLNELGWFKERTCHKANPEERGWFVCSECGCQCMGDKWLEAPNYCANCGARVVQC